MTQPIGQPQQPAPSDWQPAPAPASPPPKRGGLFTGRPAWAVYGGLAGLVLGSALFAGGQTGTTAQPAPAATMTVTATAPAATAASAPSSAPTTETAGYTPRKSDWKVGVKVTKKQCFGEAGCNVTVAIDPEYVGDQQLPDSGTIDVTYEISGDESGPTVGTFSVEGGQASYDKETDLSTKSSHTKITAKVTDVDYSS